jgi:hypothetical protein
MSVPPFHEQTITQILHYVNNNINKINNNLKIFKFVQNNYAAFLMQGGVADCQKSLFPASLVLSALRKNFSRTCRVLLGWPAKIVKF